VVDRDYQPRDDDRLVIDTASMSAGDGVERVLARITAIR
jgi:hypothetical protein